jgi:EthD domain
MFKLIMLLKKRSDLTREQFMDYYDNHHVPFMHSIVPRGAAVHRRNYVLASERGSDCEVTPQLEDDWDVIVEVFYESREAAEGAMKALADPETSRRMREDESRFIQPGSIRRFVVEVHETVFRPMPQRGL